MAAHVCSVKNSNDLNYLGAGPSLGQQHPISHTGIKKFSSTQSKESLPSQNAPINAEKGINFFTD